MLVANIASTAVVAGILAVRLHIYDTCTGEAAACGQQRVVSCQGMAL